VPLESIRCCARSVIGQVIKARNEDVCRTSDSSKNCTKSKVPVCLSAHGWQTTRQNDASPFLRSSSLQSPSSPTPDNLNLLQCPSNPLFHHLKSKICTKNKSSHPGIPDRAPSRRTSVEVENECAAKAQAMVTRQEKKRRNI